jgi:CRP/FNR family transcriptional regulator, cyclic AMP receptor protein
MPVNPDTTLLQPIAALPLAAYEPRRNCPCRRYENRSLADSQEGRAVVIEKAGTVIAKVTEPGAVLGEPHTADVRTLETSEFRVAPVELLEKDPAALLYVAAILAQRLNLANEAVVELKSQIQLHHMVKSPIGKLIMKMEELLNVMGADLAHDRGI